MNRKIQRILDEIERNEQKIADTQLYVKKLREDLKTEEEKEMIRALRSMHLDSQSLMTFLDGIQDGSIRFPAEQEEHPSAAAGENTDSSEREEYEYDKMEETE